MKIIKFVRRAFDGTDTAMEERLRRINRLEPKMRKLTDDELRAKTEELRARPDKMVRDG